MARFESLRDLQKHAVQRHHCKKLTRQDYFMTLMLPIHGTGLQTHQSDLRSEGPQSSDRIVIISDGLQRRLPQEPYHGDPIALKHLLYVCDLGNCRLKRPDDDI